MSLLLNPTPVRVVDPEAAPDEHGWADPAGGVQVWAGQANLQEDRSGAADRTVSTSGAAGPYGPMTADTARLYLPESSFIRPGCVVWARDDPVPWLCATVRVSRDPLVQAATIPGGVAGLTAVVATLVRAARGGEGDIP